MPISKRKQHIWQTHTTQDESKYKKMDGRTDTQTLTLCNTQRQTHKSKLFFLTNIHYIFVIIIIIIIIIIVVVVVVDDGD